MIVGPWLIMGGLLLAPLESVETGQLRAQVQTLIDALESSQKAKRDAAEAQLVGLGHDALPLLPKLDADAPAEVRLRLNRVRNLLERAAADASVQASRLSLQVDALPLAEVLALIQQQTGNALVDQRAEFGQVPRGERVTLSLDKIPFWQGVDRLLDQLKLTTYPHTGEPALALVSRSEQWGSRQQGTAYSGAFRIEPVNVVSRRELREPDARQLQVELDLSWEPRLHPIMILELNNTLRATLDTGQTLQPSDQHAIEFNVTPQAKALEVPLTFPLPPRAATKIVRLSGEFGVLLPGQVEAFEFRDLLAKKRVEQRHAGTTVVLENVGKNDGLWEVAIKVVFENAGGALESHRTWIFNNEVWLENAKGEKFPYGSLETTRQAANEVGVAYLFSVQDDLKAYKLVYRTPTSIFRVAVPFDLKDIPLP